jgi:hypothetical protein
MLYSQKSRATVLTGSYATGIILATGAVSVRFILGGHHKYTAGVEGLTAQSK